MKNNSNRYAVILSGGSGTRLWPLSRSLRPKQLLCLNGEQSLLQQTALRLLKRVDPRNLFTVTHRDHKFDIKGQLSDLAPELGTNVLDEPLARNTLPAIAWAVQSIVKLDADAVISVFPSDHAISNESAFLEAWETAEFAAEQDYLTLIGISPTSPATGYGYIQPSDPIVFNSQRSAFAVKCFVEKPNLDNATRFVEQGYLWNGGMFVFRADRFMELLSRHQPAIHKLILGLDEHGLEATYNEMPSISMDYGLAEKAENVAVVAVDMGWSDLGNWDSIYQRGHRDDDGNLTQGDVINIDTKNSLIWSDHGLVSTLGLTDIAVIQTADVTLVCDRHRTEDIKQLVTTVQKSHPQLTETHLQVHRPWGTYTVLEEGPGFKIKRIVVKPGRRLSLQLHHHRSEHWVVVSGMARVSDGNEEKFVRTNESTYIPAGRKHRLENPGIVDLVIIEIQSGQYLGEDDIVRFDDVYGRA